MKSTGRKTKASERHRRVPPLAKQVRQSLTEYFEALNGHDPCDLYEFVVGEVELPLLEVTMQRTKGNVTRAAELLGLNRGTLRKKLKKHGLQ